MPKIELLAPAKDKESAIAAINYGADAVYMGGPGFGARAAAGNSLDDIAAVTRHAHIYAAKVYLALNTVLLNAELEAARDLARKAWDMGVDAIIIQDMGLLTDPALPPVAIHASTQMHNNTVDKVRFLAQSGIKRVILPREFSLAEIAAMHAAVPQIELEAFIHGALCVSYSGQCYLSYAVGGRSANRGECAQPCRKKYTLMDETGQFLAKDQYLLSLKDLCLADYLEDLLAAGISSFKIEGRLKNINYVKNVVAYYRQQIDGILARGSNFAKASSGRVYFDFTPNLAKTFNRRYTGYFINGRDKNITQFETPKALGEKIDTVQSFYNGLARLNAKTELSPGDGLCWLENGALKGANVNRVTPEGIELQNVSHIKADTVVFRSYDHKFIKALENSRTMRKIALAVKVDYNGNKLAITAEDADGLEAVLFVNHNFAAAQNAAQAEQSFYRAFNRLGDTPFELKGFAVSGVLPFVPASKLNALRRELMDKLVQARLQAYKPQPVLLNLNSGRYPVSELDFSANVTNAAAKAFYTARGAAVNSLGAETGLNMAGRTVMTAKHCLRYSFNQCPRQKGGQASNWYLLDDKGHKYRLKFNCNACAMEIEF